MVSVAVEGPLDATLGWVLDYADLDAAVAPLIAQLDHRVLNEIPGLENPTSEVIAIWLWDRLAPKVRGLAEVRVAETFDTRCIYRGPG
jgi:6-pyruvoyltetrahydropterin/6-carboxytetrahydropterin synthase